MFIHFRVVNGSTSSGPNAKTNGRRKSKINLGLKNLIILPSYFNYTVCLLT